MLSSDYWDIFKNIYFTNVFEGPPSSKIFTGVSFRKILGLYYKRNRQLSYYEETSSYFPENSPADKNMFKDNKKGIFQECYSAVFLMCLENIFKVCDGVWFS